MDPHRFGASLNPDPDPDLDRNDTGNGNLDPDRHQKDANPQHWEEKR